MKTYNLAVQGARQIILAEIDEWRESLCSVCSNQNYHKSRCTCEASKQIIKLGEIYEDKDMAIRYAKGESVVKEKVEKTLTVAEYQKFKSEGLSDRAIMDKLGWYHTKMNEWKHEHDLIGKHSQKRGPKKVDKPKKEPVDEMATKYHTMKLKYDAAVKNYDDMREEFIECGELIVALENELDDVKVKLGYASQWEDKYNDLKASAQKLYDKASEWDKDYQRLEIDYHNEVAETKRLKDMLGNLKYTEQINVYLMERHVGFMRQLDEVTG